MTMAPRRRVVRPAAIPHTAEQQRRQQAAARFRSALEKEHAALKRWLTRLKRALGTIERLQTRIGRLERRLTAANC